MPSCTPTSEPFISQANSSRAYPLSADMTGRVPAKFNIVQISDLHLHHVPHDEQDESDPSIQGLLRIFGYLRNHREQIDLLVVTGDLVHDVSVANYDYIFQQLNRLAIPFICQAGNHDVTHELDLELPFSQRRHVAVAPDSRLAIAPHAIDTPAWRVLFLNSAWVGKIAGFYDPQTLNWLKDKLAETKKPCVIFTHHPSWSVQSRWIDHHQLDNSKEFWQTVTPFIQKLKAIFCGHVHQDSHYQHGEGVNKVQLYSVPSTSVQFLPISDEFALDDQNKIGLRQITLYNNATLATSVKRIDTR